MTVTHGDWVSHVLTKKQFWEIRDAAEMTQLAPSNAALSPIPARGLFIDIGANLGYYSLLFASMGWAVIAIEAKPSNQQALNASLCMNEQLRRHVTVVPTAAGPRGRCVLRSHRVNRASPQLLCNESATDPESGWLQAGCCPASCGECGPIGRRVDPDAACAKRRGGLACCFDTCEHVDVTPLDAVLLPWLPIAHRHKAASRPVIVKIDIEGSECDAFASGQSLFTSFRPTIIQFEAKLPHVRKCMTREAARHGYTLGTRSSGADMNMVLWSGEPWPVARPRNVPGSIGTRE